MINTITVTSVKFYYFVQAGTRQLKYSIPLESLQLKHDKFYFWTNVAWTNVAWTDVAWTNVAWPNAAWPNVAWTNGTGPLVNWSWTELGKKRVLQV